MHSRSNADLDRILKNATANTLVRVLSETQKGRRIQQKKKLYGVLSVTHVLSDGSQELRMSGASSSANIVYIWFVLRNVLSVFPAALVFVIF